MKFQQSIAGVRMLAVLGAVALLHACASLDQRPPEEQVRQRANERWQYHINGKFEQAYAYLSPASRAVTPYERWRAGIGGITIWKSAEVASVTCETSGKCIARVKVEHQPLFLRGKLGTITSALDETWLLDDGQWWLVYAP
jgi:hypothetical protein